MLKRLKVAFSNGLFGLTNRDKPHVLYEKLQVSVNVR